MKALQGCRTGCLGCNITGVFLKNSHSTRGSRTSVFLNFRIEALLYTIARAKRGIVISKSVLIWMCSKLENISFHNWTTPYRIVSISTKCSRYVQKCTQQQKSQKREHNGEFGKYGKITILPESPTWQSTEQ